MDVLSSQASIAGYKAVLLAATRLPRFLPMLMTAAGTIPAARVLVIGAGVAGLQAIATAKRLGAIVSAYDVRSAVKEQIESLGGRFVDLGLDASSAEDKGGYAKALDESFYVRQREALAKVCAEQDAVITTAAIPGKRSPLLITTAAVEGMKRGSVIIDLAAERGGNCEVSRTDEEVLHGAKSGGSVLVLAPTNLPSTVPYDASQMFSRNIVAFLAPMLDKDGGSLRIDTSDEVVRDSLLCHDGAVVNPRVLALRGAATVG
jgi:NAD(P) transhydrogenase subunit alpha